MPSTVRRPSCVLPPCAVNRSIVGRSWRLPSPATTEGTSCSTLLYEREVGSAASTGPPMICWRRALCTSTTGLSPVTTTDSSIAPTRIWMSIVTIRAPASSTPSRLTMLKPVRVKVTV